MQSRCPFNNRSFLTRVLPQRVRDPPIGKMNGRGLALCSASWDSELLHGETCCRHAEDCTNARGGIGLVGFNRIFFAKAQFIGRLAVAERVLQKKREHQVDCAIGNRRNRLGYIFSHEIRNTPTITSTVAPTFLGVSFSTSFRSKTESGRTKSDEPLISGEISETRSMLRAV